MQNDVLSGGCIGVSIVTKMARYDSMRKTDRNKKLIQYWRKHPELSLNEIGKEFKITRGRVHQLIKLYKDKL